MAPESFRLDRVTPSSFELLRTCFMKTSFSFGGRRGQGGPASWLGDVCHRVLEASLRSGWIFSGDRESELDRCWEREMAQCVDGLRLQGIAPDRLEPQQWPGYELKRARLHNCIRRLHELVGSLPPDRELLIEQTLMAREGRLLGRPDLIIRSAQVHMVVDYKSGAIFEADGDTPKEAYRRQLQLYAMMEAETAGAWPTRAELLPLHGRAVAVEIDPSDCLMIADQAIELLDRYNRTVPGCQPATVGQETCPDCVFATRCPAFWSGVDGSYAPRVLAVAGSVFGIRRTPLGGVTLIVDGESGSVEDPLVVIRNIDPRIHALVDELSVGDFVTVVGLRREAGRPTYRLGPFGRLHRLDESLAAHAASMSSVEGTAS